LKLGTENSIAEYLATSPATVIRWNGAYRRSFVHAWSKMKSTAQKGQTSEDRISVEMDGFNLRIEKLNVIWRSSSTVQTEFQKKNVPVSSKSVPLTVFEKEAYFAICQD
jgi:hypothetical protein